MCAPDPGFESQARGATPGNEAKDLPEAPQPRGVHGGTPQADATVDFIPKDLMSAARAASGESLAEIARYEFLDPPRAPGELGWLARYRVRRLLGEGGMGLVFHAEDTELLRPVALKVIRPELADKPQAAQRFMREARAMAALKHDHVVTIYEVGQERGVPFLAMEYLRGVSLQQWLKRGHKPSLDLVLRIGREIADGLGAAHKHRLIHRDIKPANIWLEAPAGRIKILDFGLARLESSDVQITQPGTTVGTPAYMAPELARDEGVGASSDLFSLGCVLYELCTGRLPFQGATVMAVLTSLSTDTPPPPRDLNPGVPPELDELVTRLLAKDPVARPTSAAAVVDAIKSIERGLLAERQRIELTATTPPPDVAGPTKPAAAGLAGKPAAQHPSARARATGPAIWIAAAALAAAMLATGVFVFVPGVRTTMVPRPSSTTVAAAGLSRKVPEPALPVSSRDPAARPKPAGSPADVKEKVAPAPQAASPDRGRMPKVSPERQTARAKAADSSGTRPERPPTQTGSVPTQTAESKPQESAGGAAAAARPKTVMAIVKPPEWGDVIDPDRDCRIVVEPQRDRATIFVPGRPHILSAEIGRVNAPRVLRELKGDFDVKVRVTGTDHPGGRATTSQYAPYHGAGILVWQDQENYVRLEIATDLQRGKSRSYVNFEYRKDGTLAASSGLPNGDGSNHLRLKRRGNEIHAAFGPDGLRWTSFPPLLAKLNDRLNVGVSAINTATKPLTAELEGFELSETREAGTY